MDGSAHALAHLIAEIISLTFVLALLDAAFSDLRSFRIHNRAPLLLLAGFPLVAALEGFTTLEWASHVAVGIALFACGVLLFSLRLWGGGDAKLMPAVGLWIGVTGVTRFLLVMSLVGCALSIVALMARHLPFAPSSAIGSRRPRFINVRHVPYGVAIAAAGLDWWLGMAWR